MPASIKKHLSVIAATIILLIVALLAWENLGNQNATEPNGTIIVPPKPLMDMVLVDAHDKALPADFLKNSWSYVVFADFQCDDVCEEQLLLTRQVVNQAADRQKLQRLLVFGDEPQASYLKDLETEQPDLVVAVLTRSIWSIFNVQFFPYMETIGDSPFFLVDPRGFLVMGYDELVSVDDLVKDLQQLSNQ